MKERGILTLMTVLALVAVMAGAADAATVLIVSRSVPPVSHGGWAGGNHEDDSLIEWLESIGYEVDVSGMDTLDDGNRRSVYEDGRNPGPPVAGSASLAAIEAADIVFISRHTDSGSMDSGSSRLAWNGLTKPLVLNGNGALIRGETSATRWGWATGNYVSSTNSTTFDLIAGGSLTIFTSSPDNVGRFENNVCPGGEIIATYDGATRPVWVKFPAGTDFDAGNGTTNKYGVAGATKVFFGHSSYDNSLTEKWSDYITDDYKATLQSVLEELAPTDPSYNPPPSVNAGADGIGYTGKVMQLLGTITDEGSDDGTSPGGVVSYDWRQINGPGTAVIDPSGEVVVDPARLSVDDAEATVTFPVEGTYELLLTASDGIVDGNDVVSFTIIEPQLVGHWTFEGNVLDHGENAEKSNGVLVGRPGGLPVYTDDAVIGTRAIDLTDTLGLEATNSHDPNLPHVVVGAATGATELDFSVNDWTVCGWVKTTQLKGSSDLGKGTIFGNGGDTGGGHRYCLIHSEDGAGRVTLVTDDNDDKYTVQTVSRSRVDDGLWHHIVGQRVGNELYIYRDGILDDMRTDLVVGYNLSGTSQAPSYIGVITDFDTTNPTIYKHLNGLVDDVRVYNYALEEADILDLVSGVELLVSVNAGPDQTYQLKRDESVLTEATAIDNGIPGELNYRWETVARPADANAVFENEFALNTKVTFPDFGVYTLRLTAEDDNLGMFVWDEVTLDIVSPTCADVIAEGLLLVGDISGPDGDPDCHVNIYDVAAWAIDFLRCVDPQDPTGHCEDPWNGGN